MTEVVRLLSETVPPPSPPDVVQSTLPWSELIVVLSVLYLVSMVAVVAGACFCRARRNSQMGSLEDGITARMDEPQPSIFTRRKIDRANSWSQQAQQTGGGGMDLASIERSIKLGFIRKVYTILATQLALTVAIVMGTIYMSFETLPNGTPDAATMTAFGRGVVQNYLIVVLLCFIPLIACLCVLNSMKNQYPHNFLLLLVFTIIESITLGMMCVIFYAGGYGSEILLAFGITLAIFCVLTLFTMQSKIDWSFLGPAIFCCLFILIFWSFFQFILAPAASFTFRKLFSLFGAIIFCLFIIYDTNNIMKHFGVDDYIIAAIELYLDVINLFRYLLLLLAFSRD